MEETPVRPAKAQLSRLLHSDDEEEEEEEEFYKLRPANKTDRLCQSWQYCHMNLMIMTVFMTVIMSMTTSPSQCQHHA